LSLFVIFVYAFRQATGALLYLSDTI